MTRMHTLLSVLTLSFCLLTGYSTPVFSNIYKWVDEEGNVHYSQQRPAAKPSEKMKINAHAPEDSSSYKRPTLNKKSDDATKAEQNGSDKNAEEDAPKVETAAEKKRRLAACAQARQQLATMQAKGQIRSRDKDGNTTYMSQEQKESRMKSIREAIAKQCK